MTLVNTGLHDQECSVSLVGQLSQAEGGCTLPNATRLD